MKIFFYGRLADALGREMELAVPPGCSIAELRGLIASAHPGAGAALEAKRVRACIGETIVPDSHAVAAGDQVAFFPPVSGG